MNWLKLLLCLIPGGNARKELLAAWDLNKDYIDYVKGEFAALRAEISGLRKQSAEQAVTIAKMQVEIADCHEVRDTHKDTIRLLETQVKELNRRLQNQ